MALTPEETLNQFQSALTAKAGQSMDGETALSRITRSGARQSIGEAEADEYLMKPFGPAELLRKFYEISNGRVPLFGWPESNESSGSIVRLDQVPISGGG